MKTKTFDCVEMKRRGAARVREKLKDMTPQEQLAYWDKKTSELRSRQDKLRKRVNPK